MNNLVSAPLVGAWGVAILTAFLSGWETGVGVSIGYLGQWLKSLKTFPTAAAQGTILVVCIGVFALFHHPAQMPPTDDWIRHAATWALAVLGVSSVAAGTNGAPRTDSIQGGKP